MLNTTLSIAQTLDICRIHFVTKKKIHFFYFFFILICDFDCPRTKIDIEHILNNVSIESSHARHFYFFELDKWWWWWFCERMREIVRHWPNKFLIINTYLSFFWIGYTRIVRNEQNRKKKKFEFNTASRCCWLNIIYYLFGYYIILERKFLLGFVVMLVFGRLHQMIEKKIIIQILVWCSRLPQNRQQFSIEPKKKKNWRGFRWGPLSDTHFVKWNIFAKAL